MASEKPLFSFEDLCSVATNLNKATDELVSFVDGLSKSLQGLNVGLHASVDVVKWSDDDGRYELERLCYEKLNGTWTITIRDVIGDDSGSPLDEKHTVWAFREAPRELRIRAAEKIPALIDALVKVARETTEKLTQAISSAKVYSALNAVSEKRPSRMAEAFRKTGEQK